MGPNLPDIAMLSVVSKSDTGRFVPRSSLARAANDSLLGYCAPLNEALWCVVLDGLVSKRYVVRTFNGYEITTAGKKHLEHERSKVLNLMSNVA